MIGSIVEGINQAWNATGAMLYGIATPISQEDQEGTKFKSPAVVDCLGECRYPDPEDSNALTIYHRIVSKGYAKNKGYGDGNGQLVTYEMKAICFGFRRKVSVSTVEEVEQSLVALMPDNVTGQRVDVIASDFDEHRIFAEEFQNLEPFLTPDMFLFAIRYRVTSAFNSKKCMKNLLINS